ncbi:hypothetical protein LPJ61_000949 [Coemansia biformis]|uniref:Uncharacterized protein n=1 Tax=Coemansia biformis TaxID=1286918 RepID=A0A9W7YG45_9FUNG|nr:hypothetical protein LPJ61_000949 [Coemansia biformis]
MRDGSAGGAVGGPLSRELGRRGSARRTGSAAPLARRLSVARAPEPLLIASSDSGEDVECVTPFSQTRVRGRSRTKPTMSGNGAVGPQKPLHSLQPPGPPAYERPALPVVLGDDADDDSDFVEASVGRRGRRLGHISDRAHASMCARSRLQPAPKRARTQRPLVPGPPSSLPLLRASSPTIVRANRSNLATAAAVVLAGCTQEAPSTAWLPSSPPSGAMLSGSTAVGSAAAPGSPRPASLRSCIPETPPASPPASRLDSLLGSPRPATNSADLSSDPIGEFCSPVASPVCIRAAARPSNDQVRQRSNLAQECAGGLGCGESTSDGLDAGGITQWYHGNLDKDGESDRRPGLPDSSDDDLLVCEDSPAGAYPTDAPPGSDGYSSPLEGFWDLRNDVQGCTQDRDLYIRQFEPTDRQRASRTRREARRTPAVLQRLDASPPAAAAHAGSQGGGRRGRGARARTGRGAKGHRQRHSSAIRPAGSQRPASSRGAVAAPVAAAYNHYADDPFLDIAGSMNWEGGGMSRFG